MTSSVQNGGRSSSSDESLREDVSDDEEKLVVEKLGDFHSAKMRFKLLEMASSGRLEDDEYGQDEEVGFEIKGPMSDLIPIRGDPEGKYGFMCKRCPRKRLHSESDIVNHLTSKGHKRNFKQHLKDGQTEEQREAAAEKKALKRKHAESKKQEDGKKGNDRSRRKRNRKVDDLSEEEIARRKEKFQRKKQRRLERRKQRQEDKG